jgi:CubicO group peptidase (beta-lactamase class C family)
MHTNRKEKLKKSLALAFLVLCLLGCKPSPIPEVKPSPITKLSGDADLASLMESIRVQEGLTALASAIIIDGKIHSVAAVGTREYGTNNWVTVNDKFLIGSCTKSFTASLAAILVDEGVLSWQTTIRDLFPDLEMFPEYENITISQLLSHRAGLPKNFKDGKTSWLIDYDFDETRGSAPEQLRCQYVEKTVQHQLFAPPGQMVHYSNSGYILAGAMIEKATGRAIEDLWTERIFKPLAISSAGYGLPAALEPNKQPLGHYWDKSTKSFVAYQAKCPKFLSPTGHMHMTMADWAKSILMHLDSYPVNQGSLINSSSLQKLHAPPDLATWDIDIDLGLNYALGWFTKTDENGHKLIWHGGRGFAFNAQVVADLNKKSAILLASTAEVPHIHPQTQLLKISEKIKQYYSGKIELPSII